MNVLVIKEGNQEWRNVICRLGIYIPQKGKSMKRDTWHIFVHILIFLCLAIQIPQVHNTTHQRRNCLSLSVSNQTLLSLWALNWNSNDHASAKLRIALSLTATGHAPLSQVLFLLAGMRSGEIKEYLNSDFHFFPLFLGFVSLWCVGL